MTLIRAAGRLSIRCDACPTTYRHTADEAAFRALLAQITEEGWKATRRAGDWAHTCPDCTRYAERRLL